MISIDVPRYRIWNLLKMSPATISRLETECEQGAYSELQKHFVNKQKSEEFWKFLEKVLRGGLPEQGKNRWKWLDNIHE